MNYFLILASISLCALFIFIFLIRLSKIVNQSERNDYVFGILGFLLMIVFACVTVFYFSYLEKEFENNITYYSDFKEVAYYAMIDDLEKDSIIVQDGDFILNLVIDNETKFVRNGNKYGKILIEVITMEAPEVWYMFDYKINYINNTKLYYVREIYTE